MKKPGFTSSRHLRSILTSGLLASLFLSASAGLGWTEQGSDREPELFSIRSATNLLPTYGLITSQYTCTESRAAKRERVKHSGTHSGVVPGRFSGLNSAVPQLSLGGGVSLVCPSVCFSQPQGRAPPQSA